MRRKYSDITLNTTSLAALNEEIILFVLRFLSPLYDLVNVGATNRYWRELIFSRDAKILWQDCLVLCIEPTPSSFRYYSKNPNYTVDKSLGCGLLSKCRIRQLQLHCFMDDFGPCLSALAKTRSINNLQVYLDRSFTGRHPLDLSGISSLKPSDFPKLEVLEIRSQANAKTLPAQPLSTRGTEFLLENLGRNLIILDIGQFTPPLQIFDIIQDYCPMLRNLSLHGWVGLDLSCEPISKKIESIHITDIPIFFRKMLKLNSLQSISFRTYFHDAIDVDNIIYSIPENITHFNCIANPFFTNLVFHQIGGYFENLQILDFRIDPDLILNYRCEYYNIDSLRVLAIGCPQLHTFYLPISVDFEPGTIIIFSEFLKLNNLYFWIHHKPAISEASTLLQSSSTLKKLIYFGFGPEDADWRDLTSALHLDQMLLWHQQKERILSLSNLFPEITIDLVVFYDETYRDI